MCLSLGVNNILLFLLSHLRVESQRSIREFHNKLPKFFPEQSHIFPSYQQYISILAAPYPCRHLGLLGLSHVAILVSISWSISWYELGFLTSKYVEQNCMFLLGFRSEKIFHSIVTTKKGKKNIDDIKKERKGNHIK